MVTPTSWQYFNKAITVGVGLNSQFTIDMATEKWNRYMERTGCSDFACLRGKTNQELSQAMNMASYDHPIKPILTSGKTSPVVDGVMLLDQIPTLVANGQIRPNTPISWNYAENDAYGFVGWGWGSFGRVPAIAAQDAQIEADSASSGFEFPSDYFDQWLAQEPVFKSNVENIFRYCSSV